MSKIPPKISADWLTCAQTVALMAMFSQNGHTARFVGGVVRNALLGEAVGDLDIATDALPQTVMDLAQTAGFKAVGTGLKHGTVTVIIDGLVYEITTLRDDIATDGRHAKVAYTTDWRIDAARRDFTMNALYVGGDGAVFDPLEGYGDLMARKVRFIGDPHDRIREDYLRILRFFRFSAQYGDGQLDKAGLAACVQLRHGLASLSFERIGSEFLRLLLMPGVAPVLDQMIGHGLFLPLTGGVPHQTRFHHWCKLEKGLKREASAIHRLGALGMLVIENADLLAKRLRLSNEQKSALTMWASHLKITKMTSEKQAQVLVYELGSNYQTSIAIHWVRSGASDKDPVWRKLYGLPDRWQCPVFPLKGRDLIEKGLAAGPKLGKKLAHLEHAWIGSGFTLTRDELLDRLNTR